MLPPALRSWLAVAVRKAAAWSCWSAVRYLTHLSHQVIVEVERNLQRKLPSALPSFRLIVDRCLRVVPDPQPADLSPYCGLADPEDLPIFPDPLVGEPYAQVQRPRTWQVEGMIPL